VQGFVSDRWNGASEIRPAESEDHLAARRLARTPIHDIVSLFLRATIRNPLRPVDCCALVFFFIPDPVTFHASFFGSSLCVVALIAAALAGGCSNQPCDHGRR